MNDMTPEKAEALRRPFERQQIGKLPKGGVTVDYVGHAATTDRLLQVDPEWTWEPLAVDEYGLPAHDKAGNLWIRLTVCGVTRLGVGDGPSEKIRIGDAIRNAAMRFGVALDLWSREELEPRSEPDEPSHDHAEAPTGRRFTGSVSLKPGTRGRMFALFNALGISDPDVQREGMAKVLGRPVESRAAISDEEGQRVIRSLEAKLPPAEPAVQEPLEVDL